MNNNLFHKIQEINKEICVICLNRIKEAVRPDCCHHIFCKLCFVLYSQSFETCPVCRKKYSSIIDIFTINKSTDNKTSPFYKNLTEDKLYRLSLKNMPRDIWFVCKIEKEQNLLILCDKCGLILCNIIETYLPWLVLEDIFAHI